MLLGEKGEVAHLLPGFEVDEEFVGFHEVLVEIVEVGEHELSPGEEMVEGLVAARELHILAVEAEGELYLVGHPQAAVTAEQIADRDIRRAPHGMSGFLEERVVEEEGGAFVWKDHSNVGEVLPTVLGDDIFGDVL